MKITQFFFFFWFMAFSFASSAQEQLVTDAAGTDVNPAISIVLSVEQNDGDTPFTFDLLTSSSNGLSEGTAPTTYVPIRSEFDIDGAGLTNDDFSYYENRDRLPRISNGQTTVEHEVLLRFLLNIDITTTLGRLQLAIRGDEGDGDFVVFQDFGAIPADINSYSAQVNLSDICSYTDEVNCDPVDNETSPTSEQTEEVTLHFFLANEQLTAGTTYTPEDNNGVFYKVVLSSNVYSDRVIALNDLQKGDSQLVVDFDGFLMNNMQGLYALTDQPGGSCAGSVVDSNNDSTNVTAGSFSSFSLLDPVSYTGQEKVEGLTNSSCYRIRLIQCDLFGFCSYASQQLQETPENIEALLKKQACFFFTAGFGREHFVVDFFQEWRNKVLRKFWLGRTFISWYYKTAPQYTPYILKTPWLQELIQMLAYILYGVIKGWWVLALFVVLAIVQSCRRKTSLTR